MIFDRIQSSTKHPNEWQNCSILYNDIKASTVIISTAIFLNAVGLSAYTSDTVLRVERYFRICSTMSSTAADCGSFRITVLQQNLSLSISFECIGFAIRSNFVASACSACSKVAVA